MSWHFAVMVGALTLASLGALHLAFCGLAKLAWRTWRRRILALQPAAAQPMLLAVAAGPLLLSAMLVGLLVIPAVLRYEPVESGESPSVVLIGFAAMAVVVGASRAIRLLLAAHGNWRVTRTYRKSAKPFGVVQGLPVFVLDSNDPIVVLLGSIHPAVYVSRDVVSRLSDSQLRAVIDHEMAHHQRHDLAAMWLLRVAGETTATAKSARKAWALRAELIADDHAAVASGDSLLIAEALTTVAALGRPKTPQPAVAAFLTSDAFSDLRVRVERLMSNGSERRAVTTLLWVRVAMLGGLVVFALSYPHLMAWTYKAVEFLEM